MSNSTPCIYNYSGENVPTTTTSSMSLDLYGLSITPPPPSSTPSNANDIQSTTTTTNKQEQSSSPVIYPWMRKVHINNPGNFHIDLFLTSELCKYQHFKMSNILLTESNLLTEREREKLHLSFDEHDRRLIISMST